MAFWAKWWPHKLILNLTDLYYSSIYWKVVFDRKRIETLRVQPWKNLQQKSFDAHKLRITGSIFNNRVRLRLEVQVGHSNQACSNYNVKTLITDRKYTVLHMFTQLLFCAGNQGNHQNFDPSLQPKKLWLMFMGMNQKKYFFEEKNSKMADSKRLSFSKPAILNF